MLDDIDKKMIYELGRNARLSYKQLARNIKSKKEIVAYRINKLIKNRIITKCVPVFSLSRLGIFAGKIYIRLHGLTKEAEKTMYDSLVSDGNISWVAKTIGRWDLFIGMYAKNIIEFSQKKEEILSKFGKYIKDYDITHIVDGLVFNRDYLIEKSTEYRQEFIFGGKSENIKLKQEELKIINLIKNDARFQTINIANKLNLDSRTVISKINNLQKIGLLQGFTTFIDLKRIKFQLHKLCIYLQNYDEKLIEDLVSFLKSNPNTIHLIKSLGSWELEIEMEIDDVNKVHDYISELKNRYPNIIKQIELTVITDELKLDFFPENYNLKE